MKLPKFLWNATYQAILQRAESAEAVCAAACLERDAAKGMVSYWSRRAQILQDGSHDSVEAYLRIRERAERAEAQLAAIRKQRSETTRRGNETKAARRFAAAAPKAAEMRGRVQ